jgi:hypothetical protein
MFFSLLTVCRAASAVRRASRLAGATVTNVPISIVMPNTAIAPATERGNVRDRQLA